MGIMSPRKLKEKLTEETGQDEGNEQKRFCADCKTTRTPLWRVGPSGPKSLCNACGIRYRKKRFAYNAGPVARSPQRKSTGRYFHSLGGKDVVINRNSVGGTNGKRSNSSSSNAGGSNNSGKKGWSESLRMRLMIVGSGSLLRTSFAKKQRCQRRRKFFSHEEKQAAFSLMALSCSTVSA